MKNQTSVLNNKLASIVRNVLSESEVSYCHLYREPRKTDHIANIDGKTIRFYGVMGAKRKDVIKDINAKMPNEYRAYMQSENGRVCTIQVYKVK